MRRNNNYEIGKEIYLNNNITLTDICKKLKISRSRFSNYLKECGVDVKSNKRNIQSDIFDNIDDEYKAYWLGFMYADGYVISNRNVIGLSLNIKDIEHVEKFKNFLKYEGNIRIKEKFNSCGIEFRDTNIKDSLINKGCIPKKSLKLKFPNEHILPMYLQKHFIRGYFDGDGCICFTEKTKLISLIGTHDFLLDVCKITGISNKRIYKLDKNSEQYRIMLSSKADMINFVKYIYEYSNIHLDRKYEKYTEIINAV